MTLLAAKAEIEAAVLGERRGPMRPGRLVSTRARISGGDLARLFRLMDAAIALGLAWTAGGGLAAGGVMAALTAALPFLAVAVLLNCALDMAGAYGLRGREPLLRHQARVAAAFVAPGLAILVGLAVAKAPQATSLRLTALGLEALGVFILLHTAWWMIVDRLRRSGRLTPTVVIVGATDKAAGLIARAMADGDLAVLGIFDDRHDRAPAAMLGVPILGDTRALVGHRIMPFVDRVVITIAPAAQARVLTLVDQLRVLPNEVTLLLDAGPGEDDAALARLVDLPLARLSGAPPKAGRAMAKRLQDLVLGALALVVAAPVMAAIAIAIRLDSPGPIFFRQRRQGFNNEEIVVWKFRSMCADTSDSGERQVSQNDPRVTRIGCFIRRTSLDELPQLFNVLAGEMSLVGPRPHAVGMKTGDVPSASLVAEYAHRHWLKPGITGWAAIKGSRGPVDTPLSVRTRVALDIDYIDRQGFWLDLYILAMTLPCLLGDKLATR
jgi:Undecaprenyl-phosphate glucose phosphotransferase